VAVKPAPFDLVRPVSIDEVVATLAEHGDEAKLMAGGQSLLPLLNMRLAVPSLVVDLTAVDELRRTDVVASGSTRYGPCVVHADIEDGRVPDRSAGLLAATAAGIGYRAIRNRGTIGGSLAHADSSAEWPVVLAALGAEVVARSTRGERTIPCRAFVAGFFTNVLADDEVIVGIDVPPAGPGTAWGLQKTCRKPGEFADSLAVTVLDLDGGGAVRDAAVWLGAAGDVPLPLPEVEGVLVGCSVGRLPVEEIFGLVERRFSDAAPRTDFAAHLHAVSVVRALERIGTERN
jgi:carbon-monoxide dehydrogenase medium subunit